MYFITKKTSKTGEKFKAFKNRRTECFEAQKSLADTLGFSKWFGARSVAFGGITAVMFDKTPYLGTWKVNAKGEATPRKSTRDGKLIKKMFDDLPSIPIADLNSIIKVYYDWAPIGYNFNSDKYIGFQVWDNISEFQKNWKPPHDCQ
jgi:hypothetical protein